MKIKKSSRLYQFYLSANSGYPKTNCDYILGIIGAIIRSVIVSFVVLCIISALCSLFLVLGESLFVGKVSVSRTWAEFYSNYSSLEILKFLGTGIASLIGFVGSVAGIAKLVIWSQSKISNWYEKSKEKYCSPVEVID